MNNISDMLPPPEEPKEGGNTDPKADVALNESDPSSTTVAETVPSQDQSSYTPKDGESELPKDELSHPTQEVTNPSVTTADPTDTVSNTTVAPTESKDEPSVDLNDKAKQDAQDITDILLGRMGDIGSKTTFKILIYGPPGGTKSSFLDIPNNLIYDQEDGLIAMKAWAIHNNRPLSPGMQSIPFRSFAQADLLIDRLQQRIPELEQFEVFSIDTFNDFHKKALMEVVHKAHRNAPGSINKWKPETDHHQENNERMTDFVRKLRDLDRNIILTAHQRSVEPKNGPTRVFPDFSESLAQKVEAMMDFVGYMEMREIDGKEVPVMRIRSNGIIHAKSRMPALPTEIMNPTYAQIKAEWKKVVDWEAAHAGD